MEPGPGVPKHVHEFGGRLYALCDVHSGGLEVPDGRRTAPSGIDPRALLGRLLGAYAVDPLPIETLDPLFSRPAAPLIPGYLPSIRLVPRP
jgi:hypothetical protein